MSEGSAASGIGPGGEWVPVFEGQRPPFRPGHELSTQHGAYSPRKIDPLAKELVEHTLADPECAHLQSPRWRPEMWAWARAEAQVQLLTEFLAARGDESGDGVGDLEADRVKAAYLLLHRAETRAANARTRLGLTPLSAARLGRDRAAGARDAVGTARIMAELHRLEQEGRALPGEVVADDDGDDEGAAE